MDLVWGGGAHGRWLLLEVRLGVRARLHHQRLDPGVRAKKAAHSSHGECRRQEHWFGNDVRHDFELLLTLAGFIAVFVPVGFWETIFLSDLAEKNPANFWIVLENAEFHRRAGRGGLDLHRRAHWWRNRFRSH